MKGKIIAFEGIDGSGKATQSLKLQENLNRSGIQTLLLRFPCYGETFFGREIGAYLNGAFGTLEAVHPKFAALLYAGDRFEKRASIVRALDAGAVVICDRYVPSNIAHQAAKIDKSHQEAFRAWIEELEYRVYQMPRPDAVLFLNTPPELSRTLVLQKSKREYTARKEDLHEENREYMQRVYELYTTLSQEAPWHTISCSQKDGVLRPIEEIHLQICHIVQKVLSN